MVQIGMASKEYPVEENSVLISRTDLKGIITYASPDFVQVSGYSEQELIGRPHNIIRHPDMPKKAFRSLWDTIKNNKPWTGIVKNKRKNGDYYWVDATVTPIRKNGKLTGYMSVRKKPIEGDIEKAKAIYLKWLQNEESPFLHIKKHFLEIVELFSKGNFSVIVFLFSAGLIYSIANLFLSEINSGNVSAMIVQSIFLVSALVSSFYFQRYQKKGSEQILESADSISSGELKNSLKTYGQGGIFIEEILLHLKSISISLWGIIYKIKLSANESDQLSSQLSRSTTEISAFIQNQAGAAQDITATLEELSATIHSISSSIKTQTESISSIKEKISELDESMSHVSREMNKLDETSETTSKTAWEGDKKIQNLVLRIQEISANSSKINEIVSLITSIADKTNLLSLNASIESARAGEAGRGFAVVAGEVSKLADQTAVSVKEITSLITTNNKIIHFASQEVVETVTYLQDILDGIRNINQSAVIVSKAVRSEAEKVSLIKENIYEAEKSANEIHSCIKEQGQTSSDISATVLGISQEITAIGQQLEILSVISAELTKPAKMMTSLIDHFEV